jgi:hypothetical protein
LNVPAGNGVGTIALSNGTDIAGNGITATPTSGASFTVDNTGPSLSSWSLNMSTKKLTLNFSESVDVSTLSVGGITIQNAGNIATLSASNSRALSDSTTTSSNAATIVIDLSALDYNALLSSDGSVVLADNESSSYLNLASTAIKDIAGNSLTAIASTASQQITSGGFTPKATFSSFTAPISTTSWAVNETTRNITWAASGNLDDVKLYYASEPNYSTWSGIDADVTITAESSSGSAAGNHIWSKVPDLLVAALQDPQTDPDILVKVKLVDSKDASVYLLSSPFKVIYYKIKWDVYDDESGVHLSDVNVSCSSTWSASSLSSSAGINYYYAYGTYNTTFSKTDYEDGGKSNWAADSAKTQTVYLISKLAAQVPWNLISELNYNPTTKKVTIASWIQKRGVVMADPPPTSVTVNIYDSDGAEITGSPLSSSAPNSYGVFWQTWDVSSITSPGVYSVKTTILYHNISRSGMASFNLKALKDEADETTAQSSFRAVVDGKLVTIEDKTDKVKEKVIEEAGLIKDKVTEKAAEIKVETGKILTATGTESLPTKIEAVKTEVTEVKPHVKSGILNSETAVKQGAKITMRYRTDTGLSPSLSVYSPKDALLISSKGMTEVATAPGIYEYTFTFSDGWGTGDFTIFCSEATKGTVDAVVISVRTSDIEDISGSVSAVLGSTAGLQGLKNVTDALSAQFIGLDKLLAQVTKNLTGKMEEAKGAVSELSNVFKQLEEMSKQIQGIGGTTGINLEKLYEVSKDKKEDITYIKNKSEELKAAMELNQKMIENVAKKPIVQSWFEFK